MSTKAPLVYGSVCSGIEAATAAWHPLGWKPAFFSEIEPFPRAVLTHHYPEVPLHGDFTTIQRGVYADINVLVGGTPCQSFSVAGLRGGMDDERGNLALEYLKLADRLRPRWLVWENVPGILSSNGGRDFGSILGGMVELGYGFAYRILDAQFFGVPQRRRRVFVVGYFGDWRPPAAVLFERHSMSGHPAPSRETRKDIADTLGSRATAGGGLGTDFELDGGLTAIYAPETAHALSAQAQVRWDESMDTLVTHSLRAEGFDASEDGTGRGTPLTIYQDSAAGAIRAGRIPEHQMVVAPCLTSNYGKQPDSSDTNAGPMLVAFDTTQVTSALNRSNPSSSQTMRVDETTDALQSSTSSNPAVAGSSVRRLTPRECERLQGFPDDYTLVPYRKKPASDGPRYRALGNSMAVPVMAWIGERIQQVSDILERAA